MISSSFGPNSLHLRCFTHGVLLALMAMRAALARNKKWVMQRTEPALKSTNSATRDVMKFGSKLPVIA